MSTMNLVGNTAAKQPLNVPVETLADGTTPAGLTSGKQPLARSTSLKVSASVYSSTALSGATSLGWSAKSVLLITGMTGAENCAAMLTRQLGLPVEVAGSRRSGLSALRRQEFGIVIVDETLVEADPQGADLLWQHAGLAVPVVINFGIAGSARVVREVRHAVTRREREQMIAKTAAALEMQSELKSTITGLLLQSQLALAEPKIPPQIEAKLRSVVALASDLRERLRPTA